MLLPLRSLLKFVSLLESSLCQNVRILDKIFLANIILPFNLSAGYPCTNAILKCGCEKYIPFFLFQIVVALLKYVIRLLFICSNNR